MAISQKQLERVRQLEASALNAGATRITRKQAEHWCLLHVNDSWYDLPLSLLARGHQGDYENFTQVGAESVYELHESGCYIRLPRWWSAFELRKRDEICVCGHQPDVHDLRFDGQCWHAGGACDCSEYRLR